MELIRETTDPLMNWPFYPDIALIPEFSDRFALCLLAIIAQHSHGDLICRTRHEVNTQHSSQKSVRGLVFILLFTASAPRQTALYGFVRFRYPSSHPAWTSYTQEGVP